jgi:sirohydrochlorin ferrochelatase
MKRTALLLIAHGSRRAEANADLDHLAALLRHNNHWHHVQPSYLELCPPTILDGGKLCIAAGAECVVMVPYFLAAGIHVVEDLTAAHDELTTQYPDVQFVLAEPLGRHPLLAQIVDERVREALS